MLFPKIAITRSIPSFDGRARKTNYDHPSAMDHSLLFLHLEALKRGEAIELPVYSYVEHTRTRNDPYRAQEGDYP